MSYYAIDFGTSNSLLTHISTDGVITSIPLETDGKFILRSLLFTSQKDHWSFGEGAIKDYTELDGEGRFFRSLKKFLPEPNYKGTEVHNKKLKISDLIAVFLREMRERADLFVGHKVENLVLGRPALYSNDLERDQLAEDRMRKACELAGFKNIHFCPEPVAAGLDYSNDSKIEKTVLIADFGGGTSDFTVMKVHSKEFSQDDILGMNGVFKAGDALDGKMMLEFISPHFGADFEYKIPQGNNILRFPKVLLKKICSPAHITHLRERDTWEFLQQIQKHSIDDENRKKLDQLFSLVECQLGFSIFHEIEKAKIDICSNPKQVYPFEYAAVDISIKQRIPPSEYKEKMMIVVDDIFAAMNEALNQAGVTADDIDQVCLTGGTAQFIYIKNQLISLFGEDKIHEQDIFQSVVGGLAKYSLKLL